MEPVSTRQHPPPAGQYDRPAQQLSLEVLASWLDQDPRRRVWLRQVVDRHARAVHRAFAELAVRGEVCESTVRLDLRVQELAVRLGGMPVPLERVCTARRALQQAGDLRFDAAGVAVALAVELRPSGELQLVAAGVDGAGTCT